jgi:hypothetical protein
MIPDPFFINTDLKFLALDSSDKEVLEEASMDYLRLPDL